MVLFNVPSRLARQPRAAYVALLPQTHKPHFKASEVPALDSMIVTTLTRQKVMLPPV